MAELRRLDSAAPGFEAELGRLLAFEAAQDDAVERATTEILEAVRTRGDAAVIELTARFDGWTPRSAAELDIPLSQARAALVALPAAERGALEAASAVPHVQRAPAPGVWRCRETTAPSSATVTPLDTRGHVRARREGRDPSS